MPKTCSDSPMRRLKLHGPTMGTRWSLVCDADPEIDVATLQRDLAAAVDAVDRQMSPWKPRSDLMRLNNAPVDTWVPLPSAILEVLGRALEISRLSDGAFDPAVGTLVDAWGFGAPRDAPDAAAIRAAADSARPAHRWLELETTTGRARKHAVLKLDLCGIAKGYAVDRMTAVARMQGIRHALAGLDGELRAIAGQANGAPWAVGLEAPQMGERRAQGVIELADLSAATSGDYRHFTRVGDTHIAHSMDGRRGAPVHNDVASVMVLAADCTGADAWATALLVTGADRGPALAQKHRLDALFVLRRNGRLVELGIGRFT